MSKKEDTPHLRSGQPGTAQADKADASYRNAPHTFQAQAGADGAVTLTVQQNYTGRRQWFRFEPDQWQELTGARQPAGELADALAAVDRAKGSGFASDGTAKRHLVRMLFDLAEAVRAHLAEGATP